MVLQYEMRTRDHLNMMVLQHGIAVALHLKPGHGRSSLTCNVWLRVAIYTPQGQMLGSFSAYNEGLGVRCTSWNPSGQLLAVGSCDKVARSCSWHSPCQLQSLQNSQLQSGRMHQGFQHAPFLLLAQITLRLYLAWQQFHNERLAGINSQHNAQPSSCPASSARRVSQHGEC